MYEDARRNFTTPESLMGPQTTGCPIIFKGRETEDKLDALIEQVALLASKVSDTPTQSKTKGPQAPSYALAASKHAPTTNNTKGNTTQAHQQPPKQAPRLKATNAITLVHEPGSDITHPGLSNAKLIKELNVAF
ncbi:uncharacterized protein MELLADRAFT_64878 [Melampsora larici-populina 98AG31]|uniref:Uncharacterized protein n=1 Tax=Melampsora larici-populina (strain 98AG31 / pathotype 3-4-7) TaxID=747676 RepID=F4RT51_MELLP|nr:uncharacterized protein MELLADRAFT_64878 [Melampsora larici-populina 98AG31]EGG04443.1 hypothetical protein MELLADRAFT_64878 [Melampsora larici-populina 98AG31]